MFRAAVMSKDWAATNQPVWHACIPCGLVGLSGVYIYKCEVWPDTMVSLCTTRSIEHKAGKAMVFWVSRLLSEAQSFSEKAAPKLPGQAATRWM